MQTEESALFSETAPGPRKRGRGRPRKISTSEYRLMELCRIASVEDVECDLSKWPKDLNERQALLDSIHEKEHVYMIEGVSESEHMLIKVRTKLPMFAPIYVFSISVERRRYDEDPELNRGPINSDARERSSDPRRVEPGSFVINKEKTFEAGKWPPTLRDAIQVVKECTSMSWGGSSIPVSKCLQQRSKTEFRDFDAPCHSIGDLENGAWRLNDDVHLLLMARCREYFLGPDYFDMCRYYEPIDLVNLPPELFSVIKSRKLSVKQLLRLFLQRNKAWPSLRSGASFVRMLDERIDALDVLKEVLPEDCPEGIIWRIAQQASPMKECGGTPVASRKKSKTDSADHSPAKARRLLSEWFDGLRIVYYNAIGKEYEHNGTVLSPFTVHSHEYHFINYLIAKGVIAVYDVSRYYGKFSKVASENSPLLKTKPGDVVAVHPLAEYERAQSVTRETMRDISVPIAEEAESTVSKLATQAMLEAGLSPWTYSEEYSVLIEKGKDTGGEYPENVIARIKAVAVGARRELEEHERAYVDCCDWAKEPLRVFLLQRDCPGPVWHPFWTNLCEKLVRATDAWSLVFRALRERISVWLNANGKEHEEAFISAAKGAISSAASGASIFCMPETNVATRVKSGGHASRRLRSMARSMSDLSFGPGEVGVSWAFTKLSVIKSVESRQPPSGGLILISIFEADKLTPQDVLEVMYACNVCIRSAPRGTRALMWIFADENALHLGGLELLSRHASRSFSWEAVTAEDEIAGLYTSLVFGKIAQNPVVEINARERPFMVKERIILFSEDIDSIDISCQDASSGETLEDGPTLLEEISCHDLPRLRSGELRPKIGKVVLMSVNDWRQLYTLASYVKEALVLVGSVESLKGLRSDGMFSVKVESDPRTLELSDRYTDVSSNKLMRVVFSPKGRQSLAASITDRVMPRGDPIMVL